MAKLFAFCGIRSRSVLFANYLLGGLQTEMSGGWQLINIFILELFPLSFANSHQLAADKAFICCFLFSTKKCFSTKTYLLHFH